MPKVTKTKSKLTCYTVTKNNFTIRNASSDASRPPKKAKTDLVPILFLRLVDSKSARTLKALCNSGSGGCLITEK